MADFSENNDMPPLTVEMIRKAVEILKKARPLRIYNGFYWLVPRHWFRLFSEN